MAEYILHIDCSQEESVVFISNQECEILAFYHIPPLRISSELNVAIEYVMHQSQLEFRDLSSISLINGPGSYTGLRIGLTSAKAICFAAKIPLILHNRLDLLSTESVDSMGNPALVILKARENEYFVGQYQYIFPQHTTSEQLSEILINKHKLGDILSDSEIQLGEFNITPNSNFQLSKKHWAQSAWENYYLKKFTESGVAEPFYLKSAFISTPKNNILHKN